MFNVIMTPPIRRRIAKLQAELVWLNVKEKLKGKLSAEEEARRREIRMQLAVRY